MSDPVARLHACRLQLKEAQAKLHYARGAPYQTPWPYIRAHQRHVCQMLDEVYNAQVAAFCHLAKALDCSVEVY